MLKLCYTGLNTNTFEQPLMDVDDDVWFDIHFKIRNPIWEGRTSLVAEFWEELW